MRTHSTCRPVSCCRAGASAAAPSSRIKFAYKLLHAQNKCAFSCQEQAGHKRTHSRCRAVSCCKAGAKAVMPSGPKPIPAEPSKLPSKSRLVSPVNCCRAGASAAAILVLTAILQPQQDTAHSCSSLHLAAAYVHLAHSQLLQACQTLQDRSKLGCICRVCIQGKALQAGEAAEGGTTDAAPLQASRSISHTCMHACMLPCSPLRRGA